MRLRTRALWWLCAILEKFVAGPINGFLCTHWPEEATVYRSLGPDPEVQVEVMLAPWEKDPRSAI